MRYALTVVAVAASLAVASAQRGQTAAVAHLVTMDGTTFSPSTLHVKVGDRVTWTNRDPFPHTATSRPAGFDSKSIAPGKSWTYRATRTGEFPYICAFHPTMTGTLIVD